ncbi:MAG TPA: nicotinate phosphoribosyltransferase [Actinomycetota bacterium]|jgi:nicotinate phosphoribosyltransferase|nr:nicotinate phosphoribosyltransferase [Actinomycetota bacterium]
MGHPGGRPRASAGRGGLLTDLYELNMAAIYLRRRMVGPATFSLFVRELPPDRGFLVAAGLEDCLAFLEGFRFADDELEWLGATLGLDDATLAAFAGLRFSGDVWAVPEGRVVLAGEPLLEVTAPIAEAQLVETALLNEITFQTAVAAKAARCRLAANGAELVDFAFRRTQGVDAAMAVARCSAMVGFAATSNVAAARRYGLSAAGTMAHSFIEAFSDEHAAFRAFAEAFPSRSTFLVDTYDTVGGVRAAVRVIGELGLRERLGIRLDSGDLGALAVAARRLLDRSGLRGVRIFASGGLDEFTIERLVAAGAPIDAFGVGTRVGVSADAPYLDTAYKLVQFGSRPIMKLSAGKVNAPGPKQVLRGAPGQGDLLGERDEPAPSGSEPLLVPVVLGGRRVGDGGDLAAASARFEADLAWLPPAALVLKDPLPPPVRESERLARLRERVQTELRGRYAAASPVGTDPPADQH